MSVDFASFTPYRSLAGGLLIGAASALLYAGSGRIAGICGVTAGVLPMSPRDGRAWRIAFMLGLLGAAAIAAALVPSAVSLPHASLRTLVIAGLLVHSLRLAVVVGVALGINMVVASLVGAIVPLVLKRFRVDPAIASSVFVVTFTVIVGLLVYLALGSVLL